MSPGGLFMCGTLMSRFVNSPTFIRRAVPSPHSVSDHPHPCRSDLRVTSRATPFRRRFHGAFAPPFKPLRGSHHRPTPTYSRLLQFEYRLDASAVGRPNSGKQSIIIHVASTLSFTVCPFLHKAMLHCCVITFTSRFEIQGVSTLGLCFLLISTDDDDFSKKVSVAD